jgi:hypothetical protein
MTKTTKTRQNKRKAAALADEEFNDTMDKLEQRVKRILQSDFDVLFAFIETTKSLIDIHHHMTDYPDDYKSPSGRETVYLACGWNRLTFLVDELFKLKTTKEKVADLKHLLEGRMAKLWTDETLGSMRDPFVLNAFVDISNRKIDKLRQVLENQEARIKERF